MVVTENKSRWLPERFVQTFTWFLGPKSISKHSAVATIACGTATNIIWNDCLIPSILISMIYGISRSGEYVGVDWLQHCLGLICSIATLDLRRVPTSPVMNSFSRGFIVVAAKSVMSLWMSS